MSNKLVSEIREALKPHHVEGFTALCFPQPTLEQAQRLMTEVERLEQSHDFDSARLRVLARVAGCEEGVPDDATAVACAGTVLGMIRHNVEQIAKERDRYKAALKRLRHKWPAEGQTAWGYSGEVEDIVREALIELAPVCSLGLDPHEDCRDTPCNSCTARDEAEAVQS